MNKTVLSFALICIAGPVEGEAISLQELDHVQNDMERLMAVDSDVAYALVTDTAGKTLATTDPTLKDQMLAQSAHDQAALQVKDIAVFRDFGGAAPMEVVVALDFGGVPNGMLRIGYTDKSLDTLIHRTATSAAITSLVMLLLGCALYVWIAEKYISRGVIRSIDHLNSSAEVLGKVTSNITVLANEVASSMTEQAAALEQTTAATEEISSMTSRTAQNAQSAKEITGDARQSAEQGGRHMVSLSAGMESLRGSSSELTDAMEAILNSSRSISSIMKTVGDIAFQTNLLSLNAAVEAARAGEAGAGFAVVAEEVRSLAMHSAKAADDTEKLVEESIGRSERGAKIATEVIKNLEQMLAFSIQVDVALQRINANSRQDDEVVVKMPMRPRNKVTA